MIQLLVFRKMGSHDQLSRPSEVNQYWGGGGLKNKSELLSHFSSSFVCFFIQWKLLGGGGSSPLPPLPTALPIVANKTILAAHLISLTSPAVAHQ
jgi:hypothetical protein